MVHEVAVDLRNCALEHLLELCVRSVCRVCSSFVWALARGVSLRLACGGQAAGRMMKARRRLAQSVSHSFAKPTARQASLVSTAPPLTFLRKRDARSKPAACSNSHSKLAPSITNNSRFVTTRVGIKMQMIVLNRVQRVWRRLKRRMCSWNRTSLVSTFRARL